MLKYGMCLGPWGDVICALGHFQSVLNSGECIYYGYLNADVLDFLNAQTFISKAHYLTPDNADNYNKCVGLMWSHDSTVRREGIIAAVQHSSFDPDEIADTNLNYGFAGYEAPQIPLALHLDVPERCKVWAQDVVEHLPRPFYLLQPFSINTNQMEHHWPYWNEYIKWLMHDQSKHYVTCGLGWDDKVFSKLHNVTRLVGKTPSVMHLWALADLADGIITTSNSLAHYCAANRLKSVILSVERNSEPTEYFHHVLKGENMLLFNKFSSYFRVCYETREFLNIWPAIEIGTSNM